MRRRRITCPAISATPHGDSAGVTATHQRRDGNPFLGQESTRSCASYRNDGHPSHLLDAARLFRLALENATPGARLHAVAEEGVTLCAIAQAIGAGLRVRVRSLAKDEARTHFDWLAGFVAIDNPTSSARWDGARRNSGS